MDYIARDRSVITGKKNLEHLYTISDFPVFIGATNNYPNKDLFADLLFGICPESGIVQLEFVLPPDLVYSGYHSEALGSVWKEHHADFVKFMKEYILHNVLEIGGSDGTLAKKYMESHPDTIWTIVEPNPKPFEHPHIRFENRHFDKSFSTQENIDGIIHSHTLEHMYDPRIFLKKVSSLLSVGQYHIFSVPNLGVYLEKSFSNVLNFEHTIFLDEYFIDYLLSEYNFEIIEKKYFFKHSLFYITRKTGKKIHFPFHSQYEKNKKAFQEYFQKQKLTIKNLNRKLSGWDGEVYLFGAHVFSQFLLNQGLDTTKVVGVLDNSKIKQRKRLYGTGLRIFSPEITRKKKNIAVILRVGVYQKEIYKQLLTLNPSIVFWD